MNQDLINRLSDQLAGSTAELRKAQEADRQQQAAEAVSKRELDRAIAGYMDIAKATGNYNPRLVQAFTKGDTVEFLRLADSVIKNRLYGVQKAASGFLLNGENYRTLSDLQYALEAVLGSSGLQGSLWISRLLQAAFSGEVMGTPDFSRIVQQSQGNVSFDEDKMSYEDRLYLSSLIGKGGLL